MGKGERHHPQNVKERSSRIAVQVENLYIRYNARKGPVIRDANFSIKGGEFIYVVGHAASGKSTLLRALGGIIPRINGELSGTIQIAGVDTTQISLREFSTLATYIDSDSEGNVLGLTIGQEMLYLAKDERHARRCLGAMGIEQLWDRETTKLSGGQQVRLVLAGVLASEAPVLMLDDPLDQLDPEGQREFIAALRALITNEERTVFLADRHYEIFSPFINKILPVVEGIVRPFASKEDLLKPELLDRWGLAPPKLLPLLGYPRGHRRVARMRDVHVSIDGVPILKGVNIEISEGELIVIQGPNGSGKTTAMLTLAGAIKPSAGEIEVVGEVGYLFQDAAYQVVAPSVYDELAIAPRIRGYCTEKTTEVIRLGLEWTGLSGSESSLDLHPQDLKMLALGAMSIDVKLLILDEPTVDLDRSGIAKVIDLIQHLLISGVGVIIITHDELFTSLAERIIWFEDGRTGQKVQT